MTEKRFKVYKVIGSFHEWSIEDNLNDKVVFGCIMHKYEADRLCELLNELHEEVMDLRRENTKFKLIVREIIEENEQLKKDNWELEEFRCAVFRKMDEMIE